MEKGFLLIIDGPSAVGKSTILDMLLKQQDLPLELAQRVTTRDRRPDDDETYRFISHDLYNEMVSNNALLEHHCYLFGMCYGLPKAEVEDDLKTGKNLIGIINLGNFPKIKEQVPNSYGVYIHASIETIKQRLESRGSHKIEQIEERLGNAKKGLTYQPSYDLVVNNENRPVEETVEEIINGFRNFIAQYSE